MLSEMYQLLHVPFAGRAIWVLLDYLAVREGIADETATAWLPFPLRSQLDALWDPVQYRSEPFDHLGALLVNERVKVSGKEFVPVTAEKARTAVQKLGRIDSEAVYEITPFGTGRLALALREAGANGMVGCEPTLLLYKIAVLNIHLHNLPAQVYYKTVDREPNLWNPLVKRRTMEEYL